MSDDEYTCDVGYCQLADVSTYAKELEAKLAKANANHEHFEREWYLANDRIEELEAENNLLKTSGIIEVAVRNPSVMEYMQHWEGRAETAEAKLAKAVKALDKIKRIDSLVGVFAACERTLAELKGQGDE